MKMGHRMIEEHGQVEGNWDMLRDSVVPGEIEYWTLLVKVYGLSVLG